MTVIKAASLLENLAKEISLQLANGFSESLAEDETARIALLGSLQKLATALETPEDVVNRTVFSPSIYMCARIAIDLRLFDLIVDANGPISSAYLAGKTQAEEQLIIRLLRGLTLGGLVGEAGDQVYEATSVTRHVTSRSVQAGMIHFYDANLKIFSSMPEYFKSNGYRCPPDAVSGPLQFAFNTPLETYAYWRNERPEFAANFDVFMAGKLGASKTGQTWHAFYPVEADIIKGFDATKGDAIFVDIAGGRGHEVAQLRTNFPEARGRFILEELPATIDSMNSPHDGVEYVKYDFFTPQPIKGARTYFLANILHNWPDQDCVKILTNVAAAMVKGYSKLLISEHIIPEQNCPLHSLGRDIGMMSMHGGVERSEKQWTALLEPVGLKIVKFYHLGGKGEGLVEATLED